MRFLLGQENSFSVPSLLIPKNMRHTESYIVSLSNVCRWLATIAEEKGVDIFPDTPASALLYKDDKVEGVITADKGVDKNGKPKEDFQRGYALRSKFTVLAEGVLGSLTEDVSRRFHLQREQRTYGLGIKEIWDIPGSDSLVGTVVHTLGYPLQRSFHDPLFTFHPIFTSRYGGGFLYAESPSRVHIGYVSLRSLCDVDHRSRLREPASLTLRGVPALQTDGVRSLAVAQGRANGVWRPDHLRGRRAGCNGRVVITCSDWWRVSPEECWWARRWGR